MIGASLDESDVYVSVHAYIVLPDFSRRPIFVGLPSIKGKPNAENLTALFLSALKTKGGLSAADIKRKLVCIAADGGRLLQGEVSGLIARMQQSHAPHAIANHCSAHRLQLAAKDFKDDGLVVAAAGLCAMTYSFFARSDYRQDILSDVQHEVRAEPNKLLRDIVTRWVSHAKSMRRVLEQYPALLVFFHKVRSEIPEANAQADGILQKLMDVDSLLGLAVLQPLMDVLEGAVQEFQSRVCPLTAEHVACCYTFPLTVLNNAYVHFNHIRSTCAGPAVS